MRYTQREVLQFVEENDVKFVKLMFCDIFGALKAVSVPAGELKTVFDKGLKLDASKLPGFMNFNCTDLVLFPDPNTLSLLPWRPQQGRVVRFFCTVKYPDGTVFEGDGRSFLKTAVEYAGSKGYNFQIGTSCEFYVFEKNDNGKITKIPHDFAGYCDTAPADRGEDLRRDICFTLEQMDITPGSSRHESGPGQNEIDFQYSNALGAADNLVTFKNVVKSVANRNGLYATFMPKPLCDRPGSGLHILLMCMKGTENIFIPRHGQLGSEAGSMIAGLLRRISDITLFLNSTAGSYSRLGSALAPKVISWSHENHAQLIRVPLENQEESGMILRSPDNTCNPYFAIGLIIYACLEGVLSGAKLCEPIDLSGAELEAAAPTLPETLQEAVDIARNSEFMHDHLPEELLEHVIRVKQEEVEEYQRCENKEMFETVRYFYNM